MKKITLITFLFIGTITLFSCAGQDECECNVNGVTQVTTEDDISNGQTIDEACADANATNQAQQTGECHMR